MKLAILIVLCTVAASEQTAPRVEVSHPTTDAEGVATEPASVCLVSGTTRQCYTAPKNVTATYEWGDGETHFSAHRFRISTYVFGHQLQNYTLQDEYITAKKYASFDQADKITVLQNEKSEILTRL